jgi:hypothetical protein
MYRGIEELPVLKPQALVFSSSTEKSLRMYKIAFVDRKSISGNVEKQKKTPRDFKFGCPIHNMSFRWQQVKVHVLHSGHSPFFRYYYNGLYRAAESLEK